MHEHRTATSLPLNRANGILFKDLYTHPIDIDDSDDEDFMPVEETTDSSSDDDDVLPVADKQQTKNMQYNKIYNFFQKFMGNNIAAVMFGSTFVFLLAGIHFVSMIFRCFAGAIYNIFTATMSLHSVFNQYVASMSICSLPRSYMVLLRSARLHHRDLLAHHGTDALHNSY